MRFDVGDEDEFLATSEELVARFEARLIERGQSLDLASDAGLVLDWKWGYADGDLAWWRTGHLDELLLEWYPRKVSVPPDLVDITLPSVAAFLGFLHEEGLLSKASDPVEVLQSHLGGMGDRFAAAMADTSKFGMAKSLFGAIGADVDLADPSSLQRAMEQFNALPFEERDRVLAGPMAGMAGRAGLLHRFRPVVLPGPDERAAAASQTVWLRRILAFVDWVGDGQPLTRGSNNITLAGARELVEVLDTDDQMDEAIGDRVFRTRSSTELPTVDLAYRWARAAGLVKVRKGRLTRTTRGEAARQEDPAELVRRLTWALLEKVGILAQFWRNAGSYAWDWHVETVDAMTGEWLLMLYDLEAAAVDDLTAEAWDELAHEFDLSRLSPQARQRHREGVGRDVLRSLRLLEGLGLVVVTDVLIEEDTYPSGYVDRRESGGTVTITPLGTWVLHDRASALGQTTVVGELADLDAAEVLERLLDLPDQVVGPEIDAWVAARTEDDAVAALVASLSDVSDSALGLGFEALLRLGPAAAPALAEMRDHPRLGPYARVCQVDLVDVGADQVGVEDPTLQAQLVAAAMDLWGDTAPSRWVDLAVGSNDVTTLAGAVAALWRVDGDTITDVLELLARDDRKPLAKAARKALFKRRSAT
jgi:hypothetical protein